MTEPDELLSREDQAAVERIFKQAQRINYKPVPWLCRLHLHAWSCWVTVLDNELTKRGIIFGHVVTQKRICLRCYVSRLRSETVKNGTNKLAGL